MSITKLQSGFAPVLIIIAIVAVLAVGGVYYATRGGDRDADVEENIENSNEEVSTQVEARGSIRSLLATGEDIVCEVSSAQDGYESSGTVFITADGQMRGDFSSRVGSGTAVESHMIVKGDKAHVWSGSQGAKVNLGAMGASASAQAGQTVDLDAEVEYECRDWSRDNSKFVVPSDVEFVDIEAMMNSAI